MTLVRLPEFYLSDVWEKQFRKSINYSFLAQLLLSWWREGLLEKRDGAGNWHKGWAGASVPLPRPHHAWYRWADE